MYGHRDVRLMNGGRRKWIAQGRALDQGLPSFAPAVYTARERYESLRARRDEIWTSLHHPEVAIVDVRSPQEYRGELLAPPGISETAQRAGHIPGAVNAYWVQTVRDDGTFAPYEELRDFYASKGITHDRIVIMYCRIGERSSHSWFVLKYLLGYPDVRKL